MTKSTDMIELRTSLIRALSSAIPSGISFQLTDCSKTGSDLKFLVSPGFESSACYAALRVPIEMGWFLFGLRYFEHGFGFTLIRPIEAGSDCTFNVSFFADVPGLKFKLVKESGLVLGISGLDGSGKSTLVDRFIDAHRKTGSAEPLVVHLLPSWIPLPHKIVRRSKTENNYTRPYSEPPVSSRLNGLVRISYYLCAFTLARFSLWFGAKRGQLIVLDRSFFDFASDLTRARIPAYRLPTFLLRALMPSGMLIYLDASPENVVARKGELSLDKAKMLQERYRATCKVVNAKVLNGDSPPDIVFMELLEFLSKEYMRRMFDGNSPLS